MRTRVWEVCKRRERTCVWQLSMMVKGYSESAHHALLSSVDRRYVRSLCVYRAQRHTGGIISNACYDCPAGVLMGKPLFRRWKGSTGDSDQYAYEVLGMTLHLNVSRSLPVLLFVGREDIRICERYIIQRRRLPGRLEYQLIRVWPET